MEIEVQNISNDMMVVTIKEEKFDMENVKLFKDRIYSEVANAGKNIELDLSYVSYIDSSGVGVLIVLQRLLQQTGKKLYIKNANSKIQEVIKLSSLDEMFNLK